MDRCVWNLLCMKFIHRTEILSRSFDFQQNASWIYYILQILYWVFGYKLSLSLRVFHFQNVMQTSIISVDSIHTEDRTYTIHIHTWTINILLCLLERSFNYGISIEKSFLRISWVNGRDKKFQLWIEWHQLFCFHTNWTSVFFSFTFQFFVFDLAWW